VLGKNEQERVIEFRQENHSAIAGQVFLNLAELNYRHPVGGVWKVRLPFVGADEFEELVLFIAIVGYQEPEDFEQIKSVFSYPLLIDPAKIAAGNHNWFTPNFDLANLPDTARGSFWLGFNGKAMLHKPGQPGLTLDDFFANAGTHSNGSQLWPMRLTESKFVYLKIIVLEETGHRQLRKILKQLDHQDYESVFLTSVPEGAVQMAKLAVAGAAAREINTQIEQAGLVDFEYFYESNGPDSQIPLRHARIWNGDGDNPSLELVLELNENFGEFN
jgi:hypothetical protein